MRDRINMDNSSQHRCRGNCLQSEETCSSCVQNTVDGPLVEKHGSENISVTDSQHSGPNSASTISYNRTCERSLSLDEGMKCVIDESSSELTETSRSQLGDRQSPHFNITSENSEATERRTPSSVTGELDHISLDDDSPRTTPVATSSVSESALLNPTALGALQDETVRPNVPVYNQIFVTACEDSRVTATDSAIMTSSSSSSSVSSQVEIVEINDIELEEDCLQQWNQTLPSLQKNLVTTETDDDISSSSTSTSSLPRQSSSSSLPDDPVIQDHTVRSSESQGSVAESAEHGSEFSATDETVFESHDLTACSRSRPVYHSHECRDLTVNHSENSVVSQTSDQRQLNDVGTETKSPAERRLIAGQAEFERRTSDSLASVEKNKDDGAVQTLSTASAVLGDQRLESKLQRREDEQNQVDVNKEKPGTEDEEDETDRSDEQAGLPLSPALPGVMTRLSDDDDDDNTDVIYDDSSQLEGNAPAVNSSRAMFTSISTVYFQQPALKNDPTVNTRVTKTFAGPRVERADHKSDDKDLAVAPSSRRSPRATVVRTDEKVVDVKFDSYRSTAVHNGTVTCYSRHIGSQQRDLQTTSSHQSADGIRSDDKDWARRRLQTALAPLCRVSPSTAVPLSAVSGRVVLAQVSAERQEASLQSVDIIRDSPTTSERLDQQHGQPPVHLMPAVSRYPIDPRRSDYHDNNNNNTYDDDCDVIKMASARSQPQEVRYNVAINLHSVSDDRTNQRYRPKSTDATALRAFPLDRTSVKPEVVFPTVVVTSSGRQVGGVYGDVDHYE